MTRSIRLKHLIALGALLLGATAVPGRGGSLLTQSEPPPGPGAASAQQPPGTPAPLPLPLKPDQAFASDDPPESPLFLNPPRNVTTTVEVDPVTGNYLIYERVGQVNIRPPRVMSPEEFREYQFDQAMRQHWQRRRAAEAVGPGDGILPRLEVGGETFDRIFGSNVIEIVPQVNAELSFGVNSQRSEHPSLTQEMQSNTFFDFQSRIQANVVGTIGEKLRVDMNYNTEATFEFEENIKVEYTGTEDEIIQKIEAGNVSMPLPGTLIAGSQRLFGFKTELKFGRLSVSSIFSQQRGESQTIEVRGGAQARDFSIGADEYEANRHFFLSLYFRDRYNEALRNLPVIQSPVVITRLEVWVTNTRNNFDNARNLVAFVDLGENPENISNPLFLANAQPGEHPHNGRNALYQLMTTAFSGIRNISDVTNVLAPLINDPVQPLTAGRDFEEVRNARRLNANEFTFHRQLGYISLNHALNADEILAVAYEYTYNGEVFRVGELSTEGISAPDALIVKLLKGTTLSPQQPTWDLMMKNIYSIDAFQVSSTDFILDVLYQNDSLGVAVNYLSEGAYRHVPLIRVLNLDNLNANGDLGADGIFDFIEGVTIQSANGRIIFPVLEPFGRDLAQRIGDPNIAQKYVFQELYDKTLTQARQVAERNKFRLVGRYQSAASAEIPLNATNIPRGGVLVTAGGTRLTEGIDFQVDYIMGTVRIINPAFQGSGIPLQVTVESQSLFAFQTKTLVGSHFDYRVSDNFNLGATVLNLTERPFTTKVRFGEEAINNTIWGLNASFQREAPLVTRAVDLLPFIQTKEESPVNFEAEFAQFLPGYSRATGQGGVVFIDDFEAGKISISLKAPTEWRLASTPQGQPELFPEGNLNNDLRYGYNRALLAWYRIDPLFQRDDNALIPAHIRRDPNTRSSHFVREVYEREIFPNRQTPMGVVPPLPILNLAFYPRERGPYNFNVSGLDAEGFLVNPRNSWGGMMRALPRTATDFEAANIEFIEFWLMDPFVHDPDHLGGDLLINLGNISEDILRDGEKTFEQGLPTAARPADVKETAWGRVPTVQSLVQNFASAAAQDVGLDGLSSADEQTFFGGYLQQLTARLDPNSRAYQQAQEDPSNDDFMYFLAREHDAQEAGILDRYKRINMQEGNSTRPNEMLYSQPDVEDLNNDNNLSRNESYFQYRISLRPQDMEVGRNFITDRITHTATLANRERSEVAWYQFKIPVQDFERIVGDIHDFKSIRFKRMLLRGFTDTVILRFASLELVRGEWRRFNRPLMQGQEGDGAADLPLGSLDVSMVSIEENSARQPVNYVLPPGVEREQDPTQNVPIEQNEQAMELRLLDLADGDARAVYRNMSIDIRQYRQLLMWAHAEAIPGIPLNDHDLTLFVRMGTDHTSNYYEYEIPLALTEPGRYSNASQADRERVWPLANKLQLELERLVDVKLARNQAMDRPGSQVTMATVFTQRQGDRTIKVRGNPNLSNIRILMIGIRNPARGAHRPDDGLPKSGVVWVNELQLSQMGEIPGGWAATSRMSVRLADLGLVTLAGTTVKPGFGSIDSKVRDRSMEDFYQYDATATLQLGRFFPTNRVNIPLFLAHSESFATPQFNPVDPDVTLDRALHFAETRAERDSILDISQDRVTRQSLNLNNVKLNRLEGTPRFYDLSNLSASYSFAEVRTRNIRTEHRIQRHVMGSLTYTHNMRPNNIVPLRNVRWLAHPYLRIIRDLNFNPTPSQVSFRNLLDRTYNEEKLRNINNPNVKLDTTFSKNFFWHRDYSLNWDLTQGLRFDFTAKNSARIDEPYGIVDRRRDRPAYLHWRDSVMTNLMNFGRNTHYNHQFNVNYNLPISKIPPLNWVSATARYTGSFEWTAAPRLGDAIDPGNRIQNANTVQLAGTLNLASLYNRSSYLRSVNQKFDQRARGAQRQRRYRTVTHEERNLNLRENLPRSITHNLRTTDVVVKVFDPEGNPVEVEARVRSDARVTVRAPRAVNGARVVVEGRVLDRENILLFLAEGSLRMLMGVRNLSASYSETSGTTLQGYSPHTRHLGMMRTDAGSAPGLPFIAGWQEREFLYRAMSNRWLITDTALLSPYLLSKSRNLSLRGTIEPIPFFRVEVSATRMHNQSEAQTFWWDGHSGYHRSRPVVTGSYSMSIISLPTSFSRSRTNGGLESPHFSQFEANRLIVANRLATRREQALGAGYNRNRPGKPDDGFPDGYGPLSPDVLIPAFLAAYTGRPAERVELTPFPSVPMPNWQVTYDGLARINPFRRFLRTLTLTHGYRSTYNIGAFSANLNYSPQADGFSYTRSELSQNFFPEFDITNISISEQFSPLIAIDMAWQNNLTTRFEARNTRTLAMSFANNQLAESSSWEYIFGAGYRFEDFPVVFGNMVGDQRTLVSDLRLRVDVGVQRNSTILRRLAEGSNEMLTGLNNISVKTSAEYVMTDQVTIRLFFDRLRSNPRVFPPYPSTNTSFGFSLRFTLTQ